MAEKNVNHISILEDFIQAAIDYLPQEVLRDKVKFVALLTVFLQRLKIMDEKMVELGIKRTTIEAEDVNLDEIGRQLGIFRNGLNDPEYRAVLMILSGNSAKSGTRPEVISSLNQIFGDGGFATYKGFNYRFDINIFNTCIEVIDILPQIGDMLPLVTHLRVTENEGYPFGFSGDNQALGFASVWDTREEGIGGMASLVYMSEDEDPYFR